jgi:hypothetical protein
MKQKTRAFVKYTVCPRIPTPDPQPHTYLPAAVNMKKLFYSPDSDIVCFLTGLLLGPDPASRAWLSQWVRAGQKRRACAALAQLRQGQCCQLAEI